MSFVRSLGLAAAGAALALGAGFAAAPAAAQQKTLKVVMHSDLKILDPIWTTAYIVRNHGYLVYDTLFAMDEKLELKPQMVERYSVSPDNLTYTFTLRDGLEWHDGTPVTSEDCIASIKRWGARDSMGQKLMTFTKEMKAVDAKTFQLVLNEPYGLVIMSLGKPSSNVPFMMPKRVADGNPMEQLSDTTGSGPFVFKKDEWKPGEKQVWVKNPKYKPRSEPASGMAGGKVAHLDRVEWLWIADHQSAINALLAGEIDMMETPPHDLLKVIEKDKNVKLVNTNPLGNQYTFRFNWTHPPFDKAAIRRAALVAFNQKDFLDAVIGDPKYYRVCKAMFVCDTPNETMAGMDGIYDSRFEDSKRMLKEAGYDGTPVLLMHSTDLHVLTNLAPVAKSLLERGGFNVNMVSMDWQTLVARRTKKELPAQGGWNAFLTSWVAADILNPVMAGFFNSGCDKAMFGWPCDERMEKLRDDYSRETDAAKQKALVAQVQARAMEIGTHANLGQWYQPIAMRTNIEGMLTAPVPVFWNIVKK
ncbi:MAG: ABC transporter substrate-binding protein [Alphaproteobacteria bacterium]|nr:ABC transporter substrate-binding protein [Alphaproteobacteria bacterium]